jgi:hypothetical protein
MADFFTRLVERSFRRAPVVRPLLAPMFAPGATVMGNGAQDDLLTIPTPPSLPADSAGETGGGSEAFPGQGVSGVHPSGPAVPGTSWVDGPVRSPQSPPFTASPGTMARLQQTDSGAGEALEVRPPEALSSVGEQRIFGPSSSPRPSQDPQPDRGIMRSAPDRSAFSVRSRESVGREVPQAQADAALSPPVTPDVAEVGVDNIPIRGSSSSLIIRPTITPTPEPTRPMPAAEHVDTTTLPPSAPTIHVTIGRIEVRAIVPPAPPAPRPPAPRSAPTTSLHDYLKQRREGRP